MTRPPSQPRLTRYRVAWQEAGGWRRRVSWFGIYFAVRLWVLIIGCFPIETNLATGRLMGWIWWRFYRKSRDRALENLRNALGREKTERELRAIARESCLHFAQVYLVEFALTPRLVTEWTWRRYVELHDLDQSLRLLMEDRPLLLLCAHYGNFELLGYAVSCLGLPLVAVMRPLDNPLLSDYLVRMRAIGGLTLVFKKGAGDNVDEFLSAGRPVSFVSDQDERKKGVFADFFGRPASWYKSISLLAMRHECPIIVGSATRTRRGSFRYRFTTERIIQPTEWAGAADPQRWITQEFAAALERGIRRAPEQYLWHHRRWKTRPKDEPQIPRPPVLQLAANSEAAE